MEQIKVVNGIVATLATKVYKVKDHSGKSITQPDMTIPVSKILERSRLGMQIQGFEPIYYGNRHKELIGFENMDKIEQLEFSRQFKKSATTQMEQAKAEALARAEALEKAKNEAILQSQTEKQL